MRKRSGKSNGNRPHRVNLCKLANPPTGINEQGRGASGGRLALFAFSWRDVAALLEVGVGTAQKMARSGKFSPTDLESIVAFWDSRQARRISDYVKVSVSADPIGLARDSGCLVVAP